MQKKRQIERRRAAFKRFMEERGYTVASLARHADLPASTLYSYVGGKTDSLKGTTEQAIADNLAVSTADLYPGEGRAAIKSPFLSLPDDPLKAAYKLVDEISRARPTPLDVDQKAELARRLYDALTAVEPE